MSEKIVLIDGHSILNRAFYGIPLLTNSEGLHTNAVYGFLNIMFKVLEEEQPQYLAVAFDVHAPTFRHERYAAYKGTRHAMPDELREQVPVMKDLLTAMQIPLMMLEGFEADDLIGTVSAQAEEKGLDVRIISGDRDLLQLASDTTMVRIPKTKKTGTEVEDYLAKDVKERYQVTPEEFIQVKALMGDSSDNIPGIPGVGEKTATKIIAQYHTIQNAHDHLDDIKPPRAQASLRDYWEDALLSEWLARIDRNAPFELDFDKARLKDIYTSDALSFIKELELRTMIKRFASHMDGADGAGASPVSSDNADGSSDEKLDFRILTDAKERSEFCASINGQAIGLQLLPVSDAPAAAGAAVSQEKGTVFLPDVTKQELRDILNAAKHIRMIDAKEQLYYLDDGSAFDEEKFFDCAIAAYLLNPLQGDYPYDAIAQAYVSWQLPSKEELVGKKAEKSVDHPDVYMTCLQAMTARAAAAPLKERLRSDEMLDLFENIEMPLVFVLYNMQREGIAVRAQELKEYGEKLTGRIGELEQQIYEQAGKEFNINSPKQLGVVLFEDLKLPYGKKTKTGYSTAADVLEKLAEEHAIVSDILEYRQLTKLKSTYADGLSAFISEDGRIHGKFNQTITATGRISSTDPNLQNIPVRTELGRQLRKVFVPKDGAVFVDADYSQIELRVLAHVSGDENLIEAYNSAEDIHAITASQVFHVPLEDVTPQLRRNAKAVNFGIVYGISSFGLSQGLSITREEASQYIAQYFKTYPDIKQYLDNCVSDAKERGWSVTLFGRRRPIPELKESNYMRRSFGERVAMNAPIQGTAADIIKIAMIGVDRRLRAEGLKSRLILQVHDELLVEADRSETKKVMQILREEMEGAAKLRVRLEIDMHAGGNWFEAH